MIENLYSGIRPKNKITAPISFRIERNKEMKNKEY
jgi:hypothetical protein